jgi:membrane-associated protease RseP (regulator of RpoE activity)
MSHVISDKPPPVIIALAKEVMPEQESERSLQSKSLSSFSALATLFTTLVYAVSSFALNPSFFNAVVNENDVSSFHLCLPIFFGVLAVSALHEVGHVVAAKTYGVKLGVPVLLPSLQVGCFGSITPLRSFPKSRSVLFDIAVSGPGTAMLASLAMVVLGLWLTITAQSFTNFPFVPAALMKSSFLVGSIASIVFPKVMLTPLSSPIPIHPLFLIGIAGLYMSSVNLLPIGRLDGGRASMAAWGRRSASLISLASLLLLAFFSFNGLSGIIAFWGAMLVLTRQRQEDIPALNEVSDIGFFRIASYNALLILSLLTIAPFPGNVSTF